MKKRLVIFIFGILVVLLSLLTQISPYVGTPQIIPPPSNSICFDDEGNTKPNIPPWIETASDGEDKLCIRKSDDGPSYTDWTQGNPLVDPITMINWNERDYTRHQRLCPNGYEAKTPERSKFPADYLKYSSGNSCCPTKTISSKTVKKYQSSIAGYPFFDTNYILQTKRCCPIPNENGKSKILSVPQEWIDQKLYFGGKECCESTSIKKIKTKKGIETKKINDAILIDPTEQKCCGDGRVDNIKRADGCPACSCEERGEGDDPLNCLYTGRSKKDQNGKIVKELCNLKDENKKWIEKLNPIICQRGCAYTAICDGHTKKGDENNHIRGCAMDISCRQNTQTEKEVYKIIKDLYLKETGKILPSCKSVEHKKPCCEIEEDNKNHIHCQWCTWTITT